jgi:hypothetical protein
MEESCECLNEPSGSMKFFDFLSWLDNLWFSSSAQLNRIT